MSAQQPSPLDATPSSQGSPLCLRLPSSRGHAHLDLPPASPFPLPPPSIPRSQLLAPSGFRWKPRPLTTEDPPPAAPPLVSPRPLRQAPPLRPLPLASSPERWRLAAAGCLRGSRSGLPACPAGGSEVTVNLRLMVPTGAGRPRCGPDRTSGRSRAPGGRKRIPPTPAAAAPRGVLVPAVLPLQTFLVVAAEERVVLAFGGRSTCTIQARTKAV